jgi:hypothetical protein
MRNVATVAALAGALACSSPSRVPPGGGGAGGGATAAPAAGGDARTSAGEAPSAHIGDACAPDRASPQSTCPAGALCAPMPGGYCTAPCGVDACPAGSVCVPTGRMGELCAATCAADADCRADQGYVCDPDRRACLLPFQASPTLAACEPEPPTGPRPSRAAFQPIEVLTSASSPGAYQFEPSATLAANGDLVILYTGGGATLFAPSFLGVVRIPRDGAPIAQPLPTAKQMHFDPWLATDGAGTLHAVWLGHDGGGVDRDAEIGYARSTDHGATWTTPVAVHDPVDCPPGTAFCLDKPMVAAGPLPAAGRKAKATGAAVRVFYAAGDTGLRMRTSTDGGASFGPAVAAIDGAYGDVAIDARGAVHLVAAAATPAGAAAWGSPANAIRYARSNDGVAFTPPVTVSGPGESIPFYFVNPSVVADPLGRRIHVAYAAGTPDGRWNIVLASSADGGATWRRQRVAGTDPPCANHAVPELAMRQSGKLALTWYEFVDGAGYRAYTTCRADGTQCKTPVPIGPPMATYELVRHSPRWLGEYAALVPDDARGRMHAVWTQILGDAPRGTARIVHALAP